MKKFGKLVSLSLAGIMLVSMPVMAASSPSKLSPEQIEEQAARAAENAKAAEQTRILAVEAKASEAKALAAEASGIPMAVSVAAEGEGKTVGEFINNAVTELPGLPDATPLAQGGHVIINGAPSNQTFSVLKPVAAAVTSAKSYASTLGGNVLNVAKIDASVGGFNTATVNFYMPGVAAGNNIQVYQLTDGQWSSVNVAEVRADHVVVDMTSLGTIAFIEVPAAQ